MNAIQNEISMNSNKLQEQIEGRRVKKKAMIAVAIVIGGFSVYVAVQSPDYVVSREMLVQSDPETLFVYINNARKSNEWMPWQDADPQLQMEYSGPDEGVGSKSSWNSAGPMGTGQSEIVESVPNVMVKTQLTYVKPMPMQQLAEMSLIPNETGTIVRWSVSGKNNFLGRLFCTFMNMDKIVGSEFEKGLVNLKKMVESQK